MELETGTAAIIALALGAFLLLLANRLRKKSNKQRPRPPQPPSWPIIGHLHLFNTKQPIHRILSSLSQRYGGIMHLQLGCRPLLVISSSHLAKECFTTNDKIFASRPRIAAGEHLGYRYKSFFLAPYSKYWQNLRRLCTLQLFSAHRIASFKHVRQEEVSALIRSLFESCQQQPTTVNMKSRLSELTFTVIARMVCGETVFGSARSENSQRAAHVNEMIHEFLYLVGAFNVGDYLPFLKWLDLQGLEAAMKKLHKKRDDFMQKLVDQHHEKRRIQRHLQTEEDLIDVLLSATENHEILSEDDDNNTVLKANALIIIDGGTDTAAVTLEWALAALLQNPHIMGKAQQELDTHIGRERVIEESDLHKLKYLEMIVKETLRLYPAGPLLITHESAEDCTVGGYHVKAGTRLMVNAWAIHRDPALWDCPLEFDPDRFLKNEREIDVKGHNFELIPFGSGRRMCPGMSLALCVVSYTLARLLQCLEWSVPAGSKIEMEEGLGLSMPKAVPLQAVINPRLPLHLYS